LFCNELRKGVHIASGKGEVAKNNADVSGFYLIRPDGSFTSTYSYLKGYVDDSVFVVNTTEIPANKTFQLTERIRFFEFHVEVKQIGLSNTVKGKKTYRNKVTAAVSVDGKTYTNIVLDAYASVSDGSKTKITFVNNDPVAADVRYVKFTVFPAAKPVGFKAYKMTIK
jgi:cytochrome oxidase Cu insertion factor (SCO1/SenC/PrrC family)